jgi:peptidylprolyl isomerase
MRRRRHKSNKGKIAALAVMVVIVISIVAAYQLTSNNSASMPVLTHSKVLMITSMGNFTIQLYDDMPITAGNFIDLIDASAYDGTIFHRIVQSFVVQGGDVSRTYGIVPPIADEFLGKHHNTVGMVAMAKVSSVSGIVPNSATSQFFINLKDNSATLDKDFSVFGKVISGMDVVQQIGVVPVNATTERPLQDVTLFSATFLD